MTYLIWILGRGQPEDDVKKYITSEAASKERSHQTSAVVAKHRNLKSGPHKATVLLLE